MATLIKTIQFPGVDIVLQEWEKYKDIFVKDGIIPFRNAFISFEEQKRLFVGLGEKIGWHVSTPYDEDHRRIEKKTYDHCVLTWHVEHSYWQNPVSAASWYMHTFKEKNPKNGRTLFYPMDKYFDNLSEEEKEFSLSAYIKLIHDPDRGHNLYEFIDPSKNWSVGEEYVTKRPIAIDHFVSGKKVYRIANLGVLPDHFDSIHFLDNVNGEKPTKDQEKAYARQTLQAKQKVAKNFASETDDICLIHEWQEGDMLIPDLFKMAHSITGGFQSANREFHGIWANQFPWAVERKTYDNIITLVRNSNGDVH